MKQFHVLSSDEKKIYLEEASAKSGIQPVVIEKDYWVVWILRIMFGIEELSTSLTFKGGTSLSKVYGLVQRFSEDVDLSIEKSFLGVGQENAPENAVSRKKRTQALKDLAQACRDYIQTKLIHDLKERISNNLEGITDWDLKMDDRDPDHQTISFVYPTIMASQNSYLEKAVKIELGARSEHWPVSQHMIQSYLKSALQDVIDEPETKVTVLNAERTFWEKATILHQYAHLPESKMIKLRHSRHYYDFYQLLNSFVKELAVKNPTLLERVAEHKEIYFHSSWANYLSAKKGTLKLFPPKRILDDLKDDYRLMEMMFFDKPPSWEKIMSTIEEFESEFNK